MGCSVERERGNYKIVIQFYQETILHND